MKDMVRNLITYLSLAIILLLPASAVAGTLTVYDNTWMRPWSGGAPTTAGSSWPDWTDTPIASASEQNQWKISRVSFTWSAAGNLQEMQIYTNYPQAGLDSAGQGDIALDCNRDGIFETGIKMSGPNLGTIYSVASWQNPNDFWSSGGYIYTGQYAPLGVKDPNAPVPNTVINQVNGVLGQATVTWTAGIDTAYIIDITFPSTFDAAGVWNDFNFTVGSGDCANDFMAGSVPLPASLLLLASGLLGLGLLSRRERRGKIGKIGE